MNVFYKIADKLHLTLFWQTRRLIKRLRNEADEECKYKMLARFLVRIARKMPLGYFSGNFDLTCESTSWDDVYSWLDYFSDRWNLQRVLRLYAWIDEHNRNKEEV